MGTINNAPSSNLEVLTLALTQSIQDQGALSEILEKMHQHAINKEEEKKEKSKKWHQATKRLVLFASSVDRTMPELNIPDSFCGLRWTTRISNH
jgi:hypothetical protein